MSQDPVRTALYGGLVTVAALIGGLVLSFLLGSVVFDALPGHSIDNPNPVHIGIAAIAAVTGVLMGSALWGIWMGRLAGSHERGAHRARLARAGMLGFVPITFGLAILLQALEPLILGQLAAQFPINRLFTFIFTPTAFLIAGVGAWVLGRALVGGPWAASLFWQVGLAAAGAFLAVNLVMEALGWQVGGPGAAERNTMLTVMFAGNVAAALVGGAFLGWRLALAPETKTAAPPAFADAKPGSTVP